MSKARAIRIGIILVVYVLIIAFLGWTWFAIIAGALVVTLGLLCLMQKRRSRSPSRS